VESVAGSGKIARLGNRLAAPRLRKALVVAWVVAVIALGTWYYWDSLFWTPFNAFSRWDRPTPSYQFVDKGDVAAIMKTVDKGTSARGMATWFTGSWTADYTQYYRPVALFSLWLDRAAWGHRALPFRVHNLLLHLLNALLLALLVSRLARSFWPGAVAGLIWASYPPVMVAITWLAARCELLSAFFSLSALILVVSMKRDDRRRYMWPGALLLFLLALGSKEMSVTVPVLVGAWMLAWPNPPSRARRAAIAGSFVAVLAGFWAVRTLAMGTITSTTILPHQPFQVNVPLWWARFVAGAIMYPLYFRPWSGLGWLWLVTPGFYKLILYEVVFWGCAVLLWRTCRMPALAFVTWKGVTIIPIFVVIHFMAWSHYWYFPFMGSAALVGLAVWRVGAWAPSAGRWLGAKAGSLFEGFALLPGRKPLGDRQVPPAMSEGGVVSIEERAEGVGDPVGPGAVGRGACGRAAPRGRARGR
jgi:hypothetical protein